jgi:NADH dehydrogenase/NADH:ubiquinone oxidoreductase subunit G
MSRAGRQFQRVATRSGPAVTLSFDGAPVVATAGDSVLAALLSHGLVLRRHEFGGEPRAGFCLMGACQDCWVWSGHSGRLRACTTPVADGMALFTGPPTPMPAHD